MPQTSPAGGLSLILHILINIVVFLYKKAVKLFKLAENNFIANSFSKLTNKEGEGAFRSVLAYCFILFTLLAMGSNFLFVTIRLVKLGEKEVSAHVEDLSVTNLFNNDLNVNSAVSTSTQEAETVSTSTTPSVFKKINVSIGNIGDVENMSLVDFMRNVGIVDTSFESRANLAFELNVVTSPDQYNGRVEQNKQIVEKLKEELNKHLVNQN